MSGGEEFVADVAQGALASRALEPTHGEAPGGVERGDARCLNCGTVLIGPHCHSCGQARQVHRTLRAFFHDLLHGVFHFEGKFWRTLPLLVWRPGKLTREYVEGRRANYVSPIALFLFVVFLSFAVFNQLAGPVDWAQVNADGKQAGFEASRQATRDEIAKLELVIARAGGEARADPATLVKIKQARERLATMDTVRKGVFPELEIDAVSPADRNLVSQINAMWQKVQANPQLTLYKLQSNAYKFSWLLVPISVPFLWLLFPFSRRFHLYDHTVFATYSLSFMTLLLATATLAQQSAWTAWFATLAMIYVPLHLYRQLREAYDLTRRAALWRLPLLLAFAFCALLLWSAAMFGLVITG